MQQIVNFIVKYKYFLFFLLLELIALIFTVQSHSYHKSKFVNSANAITGGIYKRINSFKEYTNLKVYNQQLLDENTYLRNLLAQQPTDSMLRLKKMIDTTKYFQQYSYLSAKVYRNDYHKKYNYLLVNKGSKQGVKPDQGVINGKGIIGITNTISKNYATVLSILNGNSKINVRLLNSYHFGTLEWDGKDYNVLQLVDLPIQATIKMGDTIITGGKSTIFPEGIPVGTILNFKKENNAYQYINVKLFNDMSAIGPVTIITNFDKEEIEALEETITK
jgi:rod shape-determining protein MreC